MASVMLIISFLMATTLAIAGAQTIGVCYGRLGSDLPPPSEVVALYQQHSIGRMRIYDPNQQVLEALRGSNIELVLGVPNLDLQNLADNPSAATAWVQTNVRSYPDVRIRYIAVGNEVIKEGLFTQYLVRAMRNIYDAVQAAGLGQIRVSTAIETSVMETSYPPSQGVFKSEVMELLNPIISFLTSTSAPLLVNVYPYFNYNPPSNLKLSYGLFTNPSIEFTDGGLEYQNLFDAQLDAMYASLEKASGSSLEIVVSESGWPSAGGQDASIYNARTYNQNLIQHVRGGSPKKPGRAIETYVFAMFNENGKNPEYEKNFGLFYPDKRPVYPINFS